MFFVTIIASLVCLLGFEYAFAPFNYSVVWLKTYCSEYLSSGSVLFCLISSCIENKRHNLVKTKAYCVVYK